MFKFPTTPHISSHSIMERTDKVLEKFEISDLLSHEIIIEEKIDGANLGISFNDNGTIQLQNRGHILSAPLLGQWKPLRNWIQIHEDRLFDVLEDRYILFGEWCYAKHSIYYTKLPDWFLVFDVYDTVERRFFSVDRRNNFVSQLYLSNVPLIAKGKFSIDDLLFMQPKSHYSDEKCEGIYIRYELGNWLEKRAKLVQKDFFQDIDLHWSKKCIVPNKLASV